MLPFDPRLAKLTIEAIKSHLTALDYELWSLRQISGVDSPVTEAVRHMINAHGSYAGEGIFQKVESIISLQDTYVSAKKGGEMGFSGGHCSVIAGSHKVRPCRCGSEDFDTVDTGLYCTMCGDPYDYEPVYDEGPDLDQEEEQAYFFQNAE